MQKIDRLLVIEKIITEESITSQEDLLKKLKSKGIDCTQATLSRNLRQLGVARLADSAGRYRYTLPGEMKGPAELFKVNIVPVITGMVEAKGMLVIRTIPGNASNTASFIDQAGRYEIAGTIAGDDTILLIPRDGITMQQVHTCLEILLPGVHEQVRVKV